MGLFNRKKIKNEASEINANSVDDMLLRALLGGGVIDKSMALSLPAVASAVDRIANTVASIPIKFYRYESTTDRSGATKRKVVEIEDDRADLLNGDTGDTLDGFQLKKAIVSDYLLDKGGYAYINRRGNTVKSINYVDATYVTILQGVNNTQIFKRYKIQVDAKEYTPDNFVKVLRSTKNGVDGESLIEQVNKAIEAAYQTILLQLKLLKRGGNKKGILQSQKKLSQDALDQIKRAWNELYQSDDVDTTPVLNEGVEFKETSSSSTELQLNESKKSLNDDINAIFHIDADENKTFKNAVFPILTAIETALNRDLLLPSEKNIYFFAFDTKDVVKEDRKTRFEAYQIAIKNGIMTQNECRFEENLDAVDGLDVFKGSQGETLYNPTTGEYFMPNSNSKSSIDGTGTAEPKKEEPKEEPTEGNNE